ncbi:acyltransferase family protein [Spirosoma jeollabukense]
MPLRPSGYMPQLNSLRTFAVLLVIVFHWFPTGVGINSLPNGTIGVLIFFVLSGFLITQILLNNRDAVSIGHHSLGHVYRNFLARRILRIFPLYFLVITFVFLKLPQESDIEEHPLYYYLYSSNILLHKTGNWADVLSPFWTLAVEEQLYLVWPWIVLLTPKNSFLWVISFMIACGIVFRGYAYTQGDLDGVLTPACLDTFGIGALWAYVSIDWPSAIPIFLKRLSVSAILALGGFLALLLLPSDHIVVVLFQRFLISVLALFIVARASMGIHGWAGRLLNNKILQYIGRISYGIYVFHMLIPSYGIQFFVKIVHHFGLIITFDYWSHRLFSLVMLITVASVSWYAFEKPINELKRYFPYKRVGQALSQ